MPQTVVRYRSTSSLSSCPVVKWLASFQDVPHACMHVAGRVIVVSSQEACSSSHFSVQKSVGPHCFWIELLPVHPTCMTHSLSLWYKPHNYSGCAPRHPQIFPLQWPGVSLWLFTCPPSARPGRTGVSAMSSTKPFLVLFFDTHISEP